MRLRASRADRCKISSSVRTSTGVHGGALRVLAAASEFVFPKRRRDRRHRMAHVGLDTLHVALLRVARGLPHFTLHDLRRTARTHLAALGVRREVAERCLGHKLKGVEGTDDCKRSAIPSCIRPISALLVC
jgi:integrase